VDEEGGLCVSFFVCEREAEEGRGASLTGLWTGCVRPSPRSWMRSLFSTQCSVERPLVQWSAEGGGLPHLRRQRRFNSATERSARAGGEASSPEDRLPEEGVELEPLDFFGWGERK
jgi:hypothetical protein